jgi:hypothetical protein
MAESLNTYLTGSLGQVHSTAEQRTHTTFSAVYLDFETDGAQRGEQ